MTECRKRCNGCQAVKPWSEFYAKTKWPDGTMRQPHSRCKECHLARNRHSPEAQRRYDRKRYQRTRHDPGAWQARLAEMREGYARNAADPEWRASRMVQIREAKRRRNGVTPDRYRVRDAEETVDAAPLAGVIVASGLSRSEIAARAGLDEATVRKATKRDRVQASTASAILDALGLTPAEVGL